MDTIQTNRSAAIAAKTSAQFAVVIAITVAAMVTVWSVATGILTIRSTDRTTARLKNARVVAEQVAVKTALFGN